jgi:integrase
MGRAKDRRDLTADELKKLRPPEKGYYLVYDSEVKRLAVAVYPSGTKVWKFLYNKRGTFRSKTQWKTFGDTKYVTTAAARKMAEEHNGEIAIGRDPQAEHMKEKRAGTFVWLTDRYYHEYAEDNLRSFAQTRFLLVRYVPKWFNEKKVTEIAKADVKSVLLPMQYETPVLTRQVLSAMSCVFQWGVDEAEVITDNPCAKIKRTKAKERERVLSQTELPRFWAAFDRYGIAGTALKVLLLTGQRPGEVCHMCRTHIVDGFWDLPGEPKGCWTGTKNGHSHRVWVPAAAMELIGFIGAGNSPLVFSEKPEKLLSRMQYVMKRICGELGVERATPHDLRRTHGTTTTRLMGFLGGRAAMNRIQNHREGGVGRIYDRHSYDMETKRVMEMVAAEMMRLVEGREQDNVVSMMDKI